MYSFFSVQRQGCAFRGYMRKIKFKTTTHNHSSMRGKKPAVTLWKMSETLDLCIEEINRSIDSISTLYFKPPGIFHNAVVRNKDKGQGYGTIITELIRDCNPKEELSLFKINKSNGVPTRKDGKGSVVDFLAERDKNDRRNRRIGLPDPKPVVRVPKEFYLKRHDEALRSKRPKQNSIYFDVESSKIPNDSNVFRLLISKFQDTQIINLLHALQNGSVTMDTASNEIDTEFPHSKRRKTIFLDDFPVKSILEVFEEVANQWPLSVYKQAHAKYSQDCTVLEEEIEILKTELQLQEDQSQAQLNINQSSSHVVTKLIQKEQNDIRKLEKEMDLLQSSLETQSD